MIAIERSSSSCSSLFCIRVPLVMFIALSIPSPEVTSKVDLSSERANSEMKSFSQSKNELQCINITNGLKN
jgi:hypothetical protein